MDGVRYTVAGMEYVGIIEKIVQMRQNNCQLYFIIRRITFSEPEEGNRKLVDVFGHIRYSYEIGEDGDVKLDFVHVREVTGLSMIVVDTYRLGVDFGKSARFTELCDDISM